MSQSSSHSSISLSPTTIPSLSGLSSSPPRSTRIPLAQRTTRPHPHHQVPHPPSPPDTIRSTSPPPPPGATAAHGPSASAEESERRGGGGGAVRALQERALQDQRSSGGNGRRQQSLGYFAAGGTPGVGKTPGGGLVGAAGGRGGGSAGMGRKWLVLVVPPMVLPHSPPPTQISGFASGYGASGRFAGGILLPLQPTLPAQLALIAREFSLPSVGGVTLYLSLPCEGDRVDGVGNKPRLMDDTWAILWQGHFDEEAGGSEGVEPMKGVMGLPIAARLEFDIDPRKARWLSSWTSRSPSPLLAGLANANANAATTRHSSSPSVDLTASFEEPASEDDEGSPRATRRSGSFTTIGRPVTPTYTTIGRPVTPTYTTIGRPVTPTYTTIGRPLSPSAPVAFSNAHRPLSLLARNPHSYSSSLSMRRAPLAVSPPPLSPSSLHAEQYSKTEIEREASPHEGVSSSESAPPYEGEGTVTPTSSSAWPASPASPDRLPSPDIAQRAAPYTPVYFDGESQWEEKRTGAFGSLLSVGLGAGLGAGLVLATTRAMSEEEENPTPKRKLIERDWEVKIRPLWEISGTPTPGVAPTADGEKAFDVPFASEWTSMAKGYPHFSIYPPVYPHFDLYPALGPVVVFHALTSPRVTSPPRHFPSASRNSALIDAPIVSAHFLYSPPRDYEPPQEDESLVVEGLGMGTAIGWEAPPATTEDGAFVHHAKEVDEAEREVDPTFARHLRRGSVVSGLGMGASGIAWMDSPTKLSQSPDASASPTPPTATPLPSIPAKSQRTDSLVIEGLGMGTAIGWEAPPATTEDGAFVHHTKEVDEAEREVDPTFARHLRRGSVVSGLGMGASGIAWMDSPTRPSQSPSPPSSPSPSAYPWNLSNIYPSSLAPSTSNPRSQRTDSLVIEGLGMGATAIGWEGEQVAEDGAIVHHTKIASAQREADPTLMRHFHEDSIVAGLGMGASALAWMDSPTGSSSSPFARSASSYPRNLSNLYSATSRPIPGEDLHPSAPGSQPRPQPLEPVSLPSRYPFIRLYRPSYPHLDIYPSLPGTLLLPSPPSVAKRSVPVPLLLDSAAAFAPSSLPSTAASPDRLESASLESRLTSSADPNAGEFPIQFPDYSTTTNGRETGRRVASRIIEVDRSIPMISLEQASLPSPEQNYSATHTGLSDAVDMPESDVDEMPEDPFASDYDMESDGGVTDDDHHELSINRASSPVQNFSSYFLPPPDSPSFNFRQPEPSPTINASEMNAQYARYPLAAHPTAAGHPDELPFVLSAGLGAALGLDDSSPDLHSRYPGDEEDELASGEEDASSQYVVYEAHPEPAVTSEAKQADPLAPVLFSFPTTPKSDDLSAAVAQFVIEAQTQSIQRRGRFVVALSGGSMPEILAEGLLHDNRVLWDKWEVFFADERLVALSSDDSTFKAYDDALFSKVPIPAWQIHSIKSLPDLQDGNLLPPGVAEEIAADMETQLVASFPDVNGPGLVPGPPRFDLILLGMGPDGHCASLFPGHALLDEKDWWVAFLNDSPKPPLSRVSFTLPLLNAARRLAFVCTGASKSTALANALDQGIPRDSDSKVPAGRVALIGHPVVWFTTDDATAGVDYPRSEFWDDD